MASRKKRENLENKHRVQRERVYETEINTYGTSPAAKRRLGIVSSLIAISALAIIALIKIFESIL